MSRTASPLKGVIGQLQARKERLQSELERINGALAALSPSPKAAPKTAATPKRRKRRMSAAAKARMSAAAKERWAKIKAKK